MAAAGPCQGYRVIDFSTMVSGPVCTQVLGDLGADVVKVEAPPTGDPSRVTGSQAREGLSGYFAQLNRNKRSLVLDLRKDEGRSVALRLVDGADVVVQNFRPGVAERLGIHYEALRARRPELVFVAITGFGPDGPYATQPAYDHVLQGLTGMLPVQGTPEAPRMIQSVVVDKASGLAAASATLAALLARERTGQGQRVDVPMLDAYAAYMLPELLGAHSFPELPPGDASIAQRLFRTWPTADGFVTGIVFQDVQFEGFCRMVEREDLLADERFASLPARFERLAEFQQVVEGELRKWPTVELVERARRFEVPFAPVLDFEAFLADPQTRHNGTVYETRDAQGRALRQLAHAARYAATPANEQFSSDQAASMVWSDAITFQVLVRDYFATFTPKAIADAQTTSEVLIALTLDGRAQVDAIAERAAAAGGRADVRERLDTGFMYNRAFQDPDGHIFELVWMDPDTGTAHREDQKQRETTRAA